MPRYTAEGELEGARAEHFRSASLTIGINSAQHKFVKWCSTEYIHRVGASVITCVCVCVHMRLDGCMCLCVCVAWCVPKVGAIVSVWPLMSTHSPPVSYMVPNCTKLGLLYVVEN